MPWETFIEVMRQIQNIPTVGFISLYFAGESFLHPQFMDMVDYIDTKRPLYRKKYFVSHSTNGLLLTPEIFDALNGKIDILQISIDGSPEANEAHRIGSSYDVVAKNARYAISRPRSRTKIRINACRIGSNECREDFEATWSEADTIRINEVHDADLTFEVPTQHLTKYCHHLRRDAVVLWNGDITTCCHDLAGKNVCGNLFDKGLVRTAPKVGPLCKKCDIWW